MVAYGKSYRWIPRDSFICVCAILDYLFSMETHIFLQLYSSHVASPELLARISFTSRSASVELTSQAIRLGLLDFAIVATVVLLCGRPID